MKKVAHLQVKKMIHESHHGKLRETKASKQYQGIQLVLIVTTNLFSTTKLFGQSNFNTQKMSSNNLFT